MDNEFHGLKVFIYTSYAKDSEITSSFLDEMGIETTIVHNIQDIIDAISTAGVFLISEEVISNEMLPLMSDVIKKQPSWSNVPFILITSGYTRNFVQTSRLELFSKYLENITLLEKPIRLTTLITVVRSALNTRKKQFEQCRTLEQLAKANDEAIKANKAKSTFLANISHEIRTPLSIITGYLELIKSGGDEPKQIDNYIEIISNSGNQLAKLINDVLDLSKIESGNVTALDNYLITSVFLKNLSDVLKPLVETQNLDFNFIVGPNLPEVFVSDEGKINQVLYNLVGNASKFTQHGAITVKVSSKVTKDNMHKLKFDVIDTGIGIEPNHVKKLFKPFSQVDDSITREFGGSGLGLALSKKIANVLNGNIKLVSSIVGEGSHFSFYIKSKAFNTIVDRQNSSAKVGNLEGLRILIVDDTIETRNLYSKFLKSAHAEVYMANNGENAMKFVSTHNVDVILMDLQMPVMDGTTATIKLREKGYDGVIIALSAHALNEHRQKSLESGFNAHLSKPLSRIDLIKAIKTHC